MFHVVGVQEPDVELTIVLDFRPFLCLHDLFCTTIGSLLSCIILLNFHRWFATSGVHKSSAILLGNREVK